MTCGLLFLLITGGSDGEIHVVGWQWMAAIVCTLAAFCIFTVVLLVCQFHKAKKGQHKMYNVIDAKTPREYYKEVCMHTFSTDEY